MFKKISISKIFPSVSQMSGCNGVRGGVETRVRIGIRRRDFRDRPRPQRVHQDGRLAETGRERVASSRDQGFETIKNRIETSFQ